MSLLVGDLDVVGDDDEGFTVLGAAPAAGRSALARHQAVRVPTPRWMRAATSQGVSRPQEEMDFLPFDPLTLSAGEGTIVANLSGSLLARPQRPFRGERLIMSAVGNDGTDASALIAIDPAIYCGAVQIGASQGGTPIAAFAATAFGVRLSFPPAGQGTDIKIYVRTVSASTLTSVTVTATIVGRAMR